MIRLDRISVKLLDELLVRVLDLQDDCNVNRTRPKPSSATSAPKLLLFLVKVATSSPAEP